MEKIYIQTKRKVITGPYAVEQLQQHRLLATDMVWFEGLNEWKSPRQVDFLKRHISAQNKSGFLAKLWGR